MKKCGTNTVKTATAALMNKYTIKQMRSTYADIYRELTKKKTS